MWGALPALLPLALLLDLALLRTRLAASRALAFLAGYFACEVLGLLASLALWIAGGTWLGAPPARFLAWSFRLQVGWANALLGLARRIYGLRIEADLAAPGDTPVLVFVRHASLVDALLPTVFVSGRHGTRLRFVMKRELLLDPCLDVVGQRLPNLFVARGAGDAEREEAAIRALARDLGPGEGNKFLVDPTEYMKHLMAPEQYMTRKPGEDIVNKKTGKVITPGTKQDFNQFVSAFSQMEKDKNPVVATMGREGVRLAQSGGFKDVGDANAWLENGIKLMGIEAQRAATNADRDAYRSALLQLQGLQAYFATGRDPWAFPRASLGWAPQLKGLHSNQRRCRERPHRRNLQE